MSLPRRSLPLLLLLLLGACVEQPAVQQELRIAVPPSYSTYLPSDASKPYAQMVVAALRTLQVPVVADHAGPGDWRLALRVRRDHDNAIPTFTLIDPQGEEFATEQGSPVPFETWRQAQSKRLHDAAVDAAPRVAAMVTRVQDLQKRTRDQQADQAKAAAERQFRADPNSLYNRPARIALTAITGAPGNGNQTLGWLLRDTLRKLGDVIEDDAAAADFTVKAKVDDVMVDEKTRRIEIFWMIHNARNQEVGEIVQLNEVPAGSLDYSWGELGSTVSQEAAGAIHDVILTQAGRR